jgi:tryptophan 2,3-dioxygenase
MIFMDNGKNQLQPKTLEVVHKLKEKYDSTGQDMNTYLEGLYHSTYLSYWDYINLDTLLTLQQPKTGFPDEKTFILYHQITELFFRLIRNSLEQISEAQNLTAENFTKHLNRAINYLEHLKNSFSIMFDGMDREQFLTFRTTLTPASGFQSAQYRIIEIYSTDVFFLVQKDLRGSFIIEDAPEKLMEFLYWRRGAVEMESLKKTFTLRQFEEKYLPSLLQVANEYREKNLRQKWLKMAETERWNPELVATMRRFDHLANVEWPLVHFRTATRYLDRKPQELAATGGTNWKEYMQPKNQQVTFYPELWSEAEEQSWGKNVTKEQIGI